VKRNPLPGGWPVRLAHAVALCAGWLLFFYWWYLVATERWDSRNFTLLVVVTLVIAPAVTLAWVAHNVRIYREKGPRRGVVKYDASYDRDWNGSPVEANWAELGATGYVIVEMREGRKVFRDGWTTEPTVVAMAGGAHSRPRKA
jgi:hypothetical protein